MNLEQASVFLSGSILFILGFIALVIGVVVINNIVHKFWKPVTVFTRDSFSLFGGHHSYDPMHNLTQAEYDVLVKRLEEIREPKLDKDSVIDKKSV